MQKSMAIHANGLRKSWFNTRVLAKVVVILLTAGALLLAGCSDDDNFEDVELFQLENKTFVFTDARAFGLPSETVTLAIGMFGDGALGNDEAPFVLTSNGLEARGQIDVDEGDTIVGRDFSRCDFEITTSDFDVDGLRGGDTVETDCEVSQDDQELQLENRDTGENSTGDLQ